MQIHFTQLKMKNVMASKEVHDVVVECSHDSIVDIGQAVAATCTEAGMTAGKKCSRCGHVIEQRAEIPALGHDYVDGVCSRCGDEQELEIVQAKWTNSSVEPSSWTPLEKNVLNGIVGTVDGSVAAGYASSNLAVLTNGEVPTGSGAEYIVGPQKNSSVTWDLVAPTTITAIRVSSAYLASPAYSGATVSMVEVKTDGADKYENIGVACNTTAGTSGHILLGTLAPEQRGCIAKNVVSVRLTFGTPTLGFANYCAEIEIAGTYDGQQDSSVQTKGKLKMSSYWQDHMVLQRDQNIVVWGKDAPGRTVTATFDGKTASGTVDSKGEWTIQFAQTFPASTTSKSLSIVDSEDESITIEDVVVGDVYLASGQSNMDRRLQENASKGSYEEPQSIFDFCDDDQLIRFRRIAKSHLATESLYELPENGQPVNEAAGYRGDGTDWLLAVGDDKKLVSSLALNFAHYIREDHEDIPIGIIHASYGGMPIRLFMDAESLQGSSGVQDGYCWNSMLAPLTKAKICGVLWYQGESDADKTIDEYKNLMGSLVNDWRKHWKKEADGTLPFYAVQIGSPGYASSSTAMTIGLDNYPDPTESMSGSNYARVRESQRRWDVEESSSKHGLAVIVDHVRCMGSSDMHPIDKNFIAKRLSLMAKKDIYGQDIAHTTGPVFSRAIRESDSSIRLHFKNGTAVGLTSGRYKMCTDAALSRFVKTDDAIRGFAICGSDGVWKDADATVDGETIVLKSNEVADPVKFHYGYWCITRTENTEFGQRLSLYNGAGLPLSPLPPTEAEDPVNGSKVADPVFELASGRYDGTVELGLKCATPGATIRFTVDDGLSPANGGGLVYDKEWPKTWSNGMADVTVKAIAVIDGKEASDIVEVTYSFGEIEAQTQDMMWSTGYYDPTTWQPLQDNILLGNVGTVSGSLAWSPISKDPANLTDGSIPVDLDDDKIVGFCDGSISWNFDKQYNISSIRISSRAGTANNKAFSGICVKDVYVKHAASDEWIPFNMPLNQPGSGSPDGAVIAILDDNNKVDYIAKNVCALKVELTKGEGYSNYCAEIEAVGQEA